MGALFGRTKIPDPEPPATMPDEQDELAKRARRTTARNVASESSTAQTRLAPVPGTIGREYSRSTLGAK